MQNEHKDSGKDGEQSHLVNDFHDRTEPAALQIRVEAVAHCQLHGRSEISTLAPNEVIYFARDDHLDVGTADEGLAHASSVDVELPGGRALGEHIHLSRRKLQIS